MKYQVDVKLLLNPKLNTLEMLETQLELMNFFLKEHGLGEILVEDMCEQRVTKIWEEGETPIIEYSNNEKELLEKELTSVTIEDVNLYLENYGTEDYEMPDCDRELMVDDHIWVRWGETVYILGESAYNDKFEKSIFDFLYENLKL